MRLISKLDLAVIVAAMVCGMMWVERGHRVAIDAPMPAEITLRDAAAAAACPDNDNMPYTTSCLVFMGSDHAPRRGERISLAQTPEHTGPLASGSECPDNDNKPYPPGCVRYLSGWFWQAN